MNRRSIYLALTFIGAIVPYVFFIRFFTIDGLGASFTRALFVNGAAGGFSADLLISSFAFWVFVFSEAARLRIPRPWAFVVVNLAIGLSCALPLFLFFRVRSLESQERHAR